MIQSPGGERERTSAGLFTSKRIVLFFVVLALELTIFFVAMSVPLDKAQQQSLLSEGKQLISSVSGGTPLEMISGIFLNNFRIALIEAVPFVGPLFLGYSIYYTGQVLQAFAISSNIPPVLLGVVTIVLPHALVEFAGYAITVTAGITLVWSGVRRRLRSEIRVFAEEILLAMAVLLGAAFTETTEILSPLAGFALWFPIVLLLVGLSLWLRRIL